MDIIYVDELFFINALMDYLLLLSAARLRGQPLRRGRFVLGAGLGGLYAALVVIPGWTWLGAFPCRVAAAAGMALAGLGRRGSLGKNLLAFLGLSGTYAGAVYAAALLTGQTGEGLLVPVSLRILGLSFALCYALLRWVFPALPKQRERELHDLGVTFSGQCVHITALRDTGNSLRDPVSGRTVAVLSLQEGKRLVSVLPEELFASPGEAMELLTALYGGKFRLLPFTAVGTSGLLLCLRPDRVTVDGREAELLIGLSPNPIGDGDYGAIL